MNSTPHIMGTTDKIGKMKLAELLSSLGAGVLGAGIALLMPDTLAGYAIPILVIGLASHATGMYQMRSLEQKGRTVRIWWVEVLYWFCWLALAGLFLYLVYSVI